MKNKKIEKILLRILLILFFYILLIYALYYFGYVEKRRIIIATVILILIISYFNLWKKIVDKVEHFLYNPLFMAKTKEDYKKIETLFEKYIPNLNEKYRLEYVLRTLIIIYKLSNPILHLIEVFILKFFISVRWLNSKLAWRVVKHYVWVIKWVIIYPILRFFMLYYEFKERLKKQTILEIILMRIRGLLISIIIYLLFMSYIIDIIKSHYIIFLFICYLILVLIPLLPEKIADKIKPQWEQIAYNRDEEGIIVKDEKGEIIKEKIMKTLILEPNFLIVLKQRRENTMFGEIIERLLMPYAFTVEAYRYSGRSIPIFITKSTYYKGINEDIYWEWDDAGILINEIKNKPSLIVYLYIFKFIQDLSMNFNMFSGYAQFKDEKALSKEDKDKLNEIYYKLLLLLKITLINLWKIEDSFGLSYVELEFDREFCRFKFPDGYNDDGLLEKCFDNLRYNNRNYANFMEQVKELEYLICFDNVGGFFDDMRRKYIGRLYSSTWHEDSIALSYEMEEILKKEYRKIREEYEKNKDKGITELINNLLKK